MGKFFKTAEDNDKLIAGGVALVGLAATGVAIAKHRKVKTVEKAIKAHKAVKNKNIQDLNDLTAQADEVLTELSKSERLSDANTARIQKLNKRMEKSKKNINWIE